MIISPWSITKPKKTKYPAVKLGQGNTICDIIINICDYLANGFKMNITIPLRLESEMNISCHWSARSKRKNKQKMAVLYCMQPFLHLVDLPCQITLTRFSPRLFDDDNLVASFKYVRDAVVSAIKPGLAPGRGDEGDDIKWVYRQEKNKQDLVTIDIQKI